MRLQDEVRAIVHHDGVIARREHRELAGAMGRLVRDHELTAVLPGVYAASATSDERSIRLAALSRWAPDAVLTGRTAGQLSFWPELPGAAVECALTGGRDPQRGFAFSKRRIPPELEIVRDGWRMTSPELTALDLCDELGGDPIDRALRTHSATLDGLHEALRLTGSRAGNLERRALLLESRGEPWSAAERLCHRLLRTAGITGWKANVAIDLRGRRYYLDVAFAHLWLVVEIDGYIHQTDRELFESDRWRQNVLVLEGWTVLRFTWRMLEDQPDQVLAMVEEALCAMRRPRRR